jgi:carboxymethylenebutenolidase
MCYDDNAQVPNPPGVPGATNSTDLALQAADGNTYMAFLAVPEYTPLAAVLIYPDVRGLHQFYKDLALRFAEVGITAIAIDYFGRTEGMGSRAEGFDFWPHVNQMTREGLLADTEAGLARLAQAAEGIPQYTMGFCLGGSLSFLAGSEQLGLAGVIGFYSGFSRNFGGKGTLLERAPTIHTPALGLFGGADQGIPVEQVEAFDQALDTAGVRHEIVIYPDAPHSFFDRRAEEYADASADAWKRVLAFVRM